MDSNWHSLTCAYFAITGIIMVIAIPVYFNSFSLIICSLPWIISVILWLWHRKLECDKRDEYGDIKRVQYFKTSEGYRTFLVIDSSFSPWKGTKTNEDVGRVIAHLPAVFPTEFLKKNLVDKPDTVLEADGSSVEIFYCKYNLTQLLVEALEDWIPAKSYIVGIKTDALETPPKTEERRYVLLDAKDMTVPESKKEVCNNNFLLIYCKEVNVSINVENTLLDNVEAYIKIPPQLFTMSLYEMSCHNIKDSRFYAQQLKEGEDEEDTYVRNWVNKKALPKINSRVDIS